MNKIDIRKCFGILNVNAKRKKTGTTCQNKTESAYLCKRIATLVQSKTDTLAIAQPQFKINKPQGCVERFDCLQPLKKMLKAPSAGIYKAFRQHHHPTHMVPIKAVTYMLIINHAHSAHKNIGTTGQK